MGEERRCRWHPDGDPRCAMCYRMNNPAQGSMLDTIRDLTSRLAESEAKVEHLHKSIEITDFNFLALTSQRDAALAKFAIAEGALVQCMASAGHPDAAEGCRIICRIVRDALTAVRSSDVGSTSMTVPNSSLEGVSHTNCGEHAALEELRKT